MRSVRFRRCVSRAGDCGSPRQQQDPRGDCGAIKPDYPRVQFPCTQAPEPSILVVQCWGS